MPFRAPHFLFLFALVTYSQNIAPLLDWRCAECHSEGASLVLNRFPFYSETTEDQVAIVNKMLGKVQGAPGEKPKMPPGNRPKLTSGQTALLQQWLDGGLAP